MRKRKFLSLLLSLTMIGSIIGTPVYADETDTAAEVEQYEVTAEDSPGAEDYGATEDIGIETSPDDKSDVTTEDIVTEEALEDTEEENSAQTEETETLEIPEVESVEYLPVTVNYSDNYMIQLMDAATKLDGLGTVESPYLIHNEAEITALSMGTIDNAISAHYRLENDITITSSTWVPIGGETGFTGVFDGNNFTITCSEEFSYSGASGLFGINSGVIKNLNVKADIANVKTNAGILVGTNTGTVDNCSSEGSISTSANINMGGLIGYNNGGTVRNSHSSATVTGKGGNLGGLIGYDEKGTVELSYSAGTVSGNTTSNTGNVGGLIGYIYTYAEYTTTSTTVKYCYSTSTVSGGCTGGLIGYVDTYSYRKTNSPAYAYTTIEYNYAQGAINGTGSSGGLIGYAQTRNDYYSASASTTQHEEINTIRYCYATGIVNNGNGGGLIGNYNDINTNTVRYSYYNQKNEGNKIGFAASESRMKTQALYYGWDFENIWSLSGSTYPHINLSGGSLTIAIEGDGTRTNPYKVVNENQLLAIAFDRLPKDAYYQLQNDITVTARNWTPIGANGTSAFSGHFDGQNYTISGVKLSGAHYNRVGLFGLNSGTISNLKVDAVFEGASYTGGIAAYNRGAIENCTVSGTIDGVTGSVYTGGLVGCSTGTITGSSSNAAITTSAGRAGGLSGYGSGTIKNCYATGNVTNTSSGDTGGLIGQSYNITIESCYAANNVTSAGGNSGGLIGYIYTYAEYTTASTTVKYCYSTSTVSGGRTGGLSGYVDTYSYRKTNSPAYAYATIEYNYAQGAINGTGSSGGLIGYAQTRNDYYSASASTTQHEEINTIRYCYATGIVNNGDGAGFLGGYNDINTNTVRYCYYNQRNEGNKIGFNLTAGRLKDKTYYYGWNFDNIWSFDGSEFPHIDLRGTYGGVEIEGFGDDDDPYIIENEEQLIAMVNGEIGPASKAYYELKNDITVTARHWTPIGANGTANFNGVFDGKGHTISGITLTNSHYSRIGFFGINDGTIKNLNLEVNFEGVARAGGIAASNNGTIENCTVSGTIDGVDNSEYTGGLVSWNSGTITGSSSSAVVTTSAGKIGGLAGYSGGTVKNCYATGNVTNTSSGDTGGLIGKSYNITIESCYAANNVTSSGGNSGGLIGYIYTYAEYTTTSTTVKYCYSTSTISGGRTGGLSGYVDTYSYRKTNSPAYAYTTIEYNYAQGAINGTGNSGGLIGYAQTRNGYYSASASTTQHEEINTIRYCYATGIVNDNSGAGFLGGYNDINTNIIRSCYYNQINAGNKIGFSTTTDMLKQQSTYYGWNFDNIWAIDGDYPYINLRGTYYGVDVDGAGDEDDPYIIENEEQLIAMVNGEIGPASKAYYELKNDITVTAAHWTPIGANGTPSFNGFFDGKGHTISGLTLKNSHYDNIGFFGINDGSIKNLNIVIDIEGVKNAGGIAATNNGTIENCAVYGSVKGIGGNATGGLAGINAGTINKAFSTAVVSATSGNAGGLIGNNSGSVDKSYTVSTVTSDGTGGGLIGSSTKGTVNESYASSYISSNTKGGLIGKSSGTTVTMSYYNKDISGCEDTDRGIGLDETEMKNSASFINWDFANTWNIAADKNGGYPYLKSNEPQIIVPSTPTPTPTSKPSEPTATPTAKPTATPTAKPTSTPTAKPTPTPTQKPDNPSKPTPTPTIKPTPTPIPANLVSTPKISIEGFIGGKTVTLTCDTAGASIYYTTDGSAPNETSTLYDAPITVTDTTTVKAIAVKDGMDNSKVVSGKISVSTVETPISSHAAGQLEIGTIITLQSKTSGAMIYYTTDGSEPTTDSTRYNGAIAVTSAMTIKAIAVKDGYKSSDVCEVSYTVPAQESGSATVSVGSATAAAGDTVSLPVYIFTDDNITGYRFTMTYDSSKFEYASVTPSEGVSANDLFASASGDAVTVLYSGAAIESGEVCSVNLNALSSATDGEYPVKTSNAQVTTNSGSNTVDIIDGTITLSGSANSNLEVTADAVITDGEGNTVGKDDISGEVTANVTVDDVQNAPDDGAPVLVNIILAVYDRDGSLVTLCMNEADLSDINYVFSNTLDIPENVSVGSIKLMIWNGLSEMTPISAVSSIL